GGARGVSSACPWPTVPPPATLLRLAGPAPQKLPHPTSPPSFAPAGVPPPLDDIRLRDTLDLYPAYGSTVARLRPAADGMPSFVAYPHVMRDGSVTPGQHASFLGKTYDPLFFREDPNGVNFRLPELTLPSTISPERLDDRRSMLRLLDEQTDTRETSVVAQGLQQYYDRAFGMLASARLRRAFNLGEEAAALRDRYGR